MSGEGTETPPLGLGLRGSWIELVEAGPDTEDAISELQAGRRLTPAMGAGARHVASSYAPPMLVRSLDDGSPVGIVENHPLPGGIAVLVIYMLPGARPGYALEALALYISLLFDAGVRLVSADVLSFNSAVIRIYRKNGWEPQARLREHVYAAGRLWDVLVYSFDRESWGLALRRYMRVLPRGGTRPAAFGGAPRRPGS